MKKLSLCSVLYFSFCSHFFTLKSQPIPLISGVSVQLLSGSLAQYAVRLQHDPITQELYYITFLGELHKLKTNAAGTLYDTLIATQLQHNITHLQGFTFKDSMVFLSGNRKTAGQQGYGIIARGKLTANGGRTWTNLLTTQTYPSSATLYDHAFNAIVPTPNGDSLVFSSGSRSDHGEIQSTNGLYPNTREVPLTTKIFIVPINANNLFLPNNEAQLDAMGVVFAKGVRNEFDIAYNSQGRLFGVENSGDRDDSEEMNWLQRGKHYGFPWEMGGNQTPMQFPNYNPNTDKMINRSSLGWGNNTFYNDPNYPQKPANLIITQPIQNLGPDADKFRTPQGNILDASDLGITLTTFTSHRSPLGLVFDKANAIGANMTGDAFVLSYTKGTLDSAFSGPIIGPFADLGEDLLHLKLQYDPLINNYKLNAKKIIQFFKEPVDAELVQNTLYVLETGFGSVLNSKVWKITLPPNTTPSIETQKNHFNTLAIYPNPATNGISFELKNAVSAEIVDVLGRKTMEINSSNSSLFLRGDVRNTEGLEGQREVNISGLDSGIYFLKITNQKNETFVGKFIKE